MYGLNPYSSNDEVETTLTANGIKLQPSVGGKPYAVDIHYALYVLDTINAVADALAMADKLDAESPGSAKAREIRSLMAKDFWVKTPERIRSAISMTRRTCDWGHESYSFAKRNR